MLRMKTSGPPQNTVIRPIAHHSFEPPRVPSGMSQAVTNAASQRQTLDDKIRKKFPNILRNLMAAIKMPFWILRHPS